MIRIRPLQFNQIVGQNIPVQLIQNALVRGTLPRAIILFGPSGVGKTTIARIIAAYFVCTDKKNNDVCGICNMCQAVQNGSIPDIVEFDAASHTSVDDIREIIDQTNYAPQFAQEKIFIIDEAHMLSKSAISAFLKIFEETAKHIRFILTTTEIEKIPDAIQSRCLCINLRSIDENAMKDRITELTQSKNIEITQEAIKTVINLSKGSLREAMSIIDQALLLNLKIDQELINSLVSFAPTEKINNLVSGILNADFLETYKQLNQFIDENFTLLGILNQTMFLFKEKFQENEQNQKKEICEKILKIMIDLNKLHQDVTKISTFNEMIVLGLVEIAYNAGR